MRTQPIHTAEYRCFSAAAFSGNNNQFTFFYGQRYVSNCLCRSIVIFVAYIIQIDHTRGSHSKQFYACTCRQHCDCSERKHGIYRPEFDIKVRCFFTGVFNARNQCCAGKFFGSSQTFKQHRHDYKFHRLYRMKHSRTF